MKCITCNISFNPLKNKPEHILLNSLGGRVSTRKVICGSCNERYGKTIDRKFSESLNMIRCLGFLRTGKGNPPPTLKNICLENGELIDLLPGFIPIQKNFKFETKNLPNGKTSVEFGAGSFEALGKQLNNIAKGVQLSQEELIKKIKGIEISIRRERIADHIPFNFSIGGSDSIKSMAKAALMLWSYKRPTNDTRIDDLKKFVDFINSPSKAENSPNDLEFCKIDSRLIDLKLLTQSNKNFGSFHNIIHVEADESGHLYGVFRLYNICSWVFNFNCVSQIQNHSVSLISNPLENSEWVLEESNTSPLGKEWFESNNYNIAAIKELTGNLTSTFWKESNIKAQENIIDEAILDYFPKDNEIIKKEHIGLLSHEIAAEMTSKIFGFDRTRLISGEKAAERLKRYIKTTE